MTNTTTFEKMVKAEKFQFIATLVESAEVIEFLTKEAEMVTKKNAKKAESRTLSKTQRENLEIVAEINGFFVGKEEIFTAQEVMEGIGKSEFSAQKATALMKKAVESGEVVKSETKKDKKVAYSAFVSSEEEGE